MPAALAQIVAGTPHAFRLRRVSRRLEQRYGMPVGGWLDVLGGRYGCTTLVGTSRDLQIRPEGLADEDVRFVGPLRAASAPGGRDEPALAALGDEELVYVSLGTVFEDRPAFFRDAAIALARPGRRVVLSVGRIAPQTLGTLPAGVTAHAHVDQLAVLRRADLFITHGVTRSVTRAMSSAMPIRFGGGWSRSMPTSGTARNSPPAVAHSASHSGRTHCTVRAPRSLRAATSGSSGRTCPPDE
jgi:UDP-glucoronosyl and UDP-glucosyl transferase